jgi:flagellar basal body rod protein FlgC
MRISTGCGKNLTQKKLIFLPAHPSADNNGYISASDGFLIQEIIKRINIKVNTFQQSAKSISINNNYTEFL